MFKIARRDVADVYPIVYMAGGEGLTLGMALKLTSGSLEKAGAQDEVTHICMGVKDENGNYPVIAVQPYMYFETTSTAKVAATSIGTTVQLHTDGLTVTATANGPFMVDETDEGDANSVVVGHFVAPAGE